MNWQEFLAMGEHGFYVWTSYGAVALVMLANWLLPVFRHRRLLKALRRQTLRNRQAGFPQEDI